MESQILKIVGQIAGIGGIAVGVLLLIFREVIRKNIFRNLTSTYTYRLFRLIVVLTWTIAVLGIAAWVYSTTPRNGATEERSNLEVTHVGFTQGSEFDVTVWNPGRTTVLINEIAIKILKDHNREASPIRCPTARYIIPVDGMREGEMQTRSVAHVVDGYRADRFLIALQTTRVYTLEVTWGV